MPNKIYQAIDKRLESIKFQYQSKNGVYNECEPNDWQLLHIRKLLDFQETIRKMYLEYIIPYEKYEKIFDKISDAIKEIMNDPTVKK